MYILMVAHKSKKVDAYGPFPSIRRAELYAESIAKAMEVRIFIQELIVPYPVVKNVIWR